MPRNQAYLGFITNDESNKYCENSLIIKNGGITFEFKNIRLE